MYIKFLIVSIRCEFKDSEKAYTNGTVLVPSFLVDQMVEHPVKGDVK